MWAPKIVTIKIEIEKVKRKSIIQSYKELIEWVETAAPIPPNLQMKWVAQKSNETLTGLLFFGMFLIPMRSTVWIVANVNVNVCMCVEMDGLIQKFSHRKDLLNCTLAFMFLVTLHSILFRDWATDWLRIKNAKKKTATPTESVLCWPVQMESVMDTHEWC